MLNNQQAPIRPKAEFITTTVTRLLVSESPIIIRIPNDSVDFITDASTQIFGSNLPRTLMYSVTNQLKHQLNMPNCVPPQSLAIGNDIPRY